MIQILSTYFSQLLVSCIILYSIQNTHIVMSCLKIKSRYGSLSYILYYIISSNHHALSSSLFLQGFLYTHTIGICHVYVYIYILYA